MCQDSLMKHEPVTDICLKSGKTSNRRPETRNLDSSTGRVRNRIRALYEKKTIASHEKSSYKKRSSKVNLKADFSVKPANSMFKESKSNHERRDSGNHLGKRKQELDTLNSKDYPNLTISNKVKSFENFEYNPNLAFKKVQARNESTPAAEEEIYQSESTENNINDIQRDEYELVTKQSRSSKGFIILEDDKLTEKVPKNPLYLKNIEHMEIVLKHYYMCRPWNEGSQESIEAVMNIPWFLKYIGQAIFGLELEARDYKNYLERHPPKLKRKDELQKKVLSKARWEATRSLMYHPQTGKLIPLRERAAEYALSLCKTKEERVRAVRSIRRIFGNITKETGYDEAYIEMERIIKEKFSQNESSKNSMIQQLQSLFCNIKATDQGLLKEVKVNLLQFAKSPEMKDIIEKAIHNMGSLVKEGLHNEAARALITNKIIVENMLNTTFLDKVLKALDEQTVNDIQTNYISKIKAAYYELEKGEDPENLERYLNNCFNTTKFSKHPLTSIQNAQAMVDYLHKLNYRAKSEKCDTYPPPKESLKNLKLYYELEHLRRTNIKKKGSIASSYLIGLEDPHDKFPFIPEF